MNTKNRGSLEFYVYENRNGDYCAVCLTLNLIEWGKDPKKLMDSINEAATSYIVGVIKRGLPDELLNKPAPDKYWLMARRNLFPAGKKTRSKMSTRTNFFSFENKPYHDGSFVTA